MGPSIKLLPSLAIISALLFMGGCASHAPAPSYAHLSDDPWEAGSASAAHRDTPGGEDRANYVRAQEKAMAREYAVLHERQLRDAYEKGARDTMEDFKGRMRAQAGFVWEPPMVEMVDMPAQQINGAIYPAHRAPVIIRPGRWVEYNGIALPDLEGR